MPRVSFTSNLKRFYPDLVTISSDADSLPALLGEINAKYPGLKDYVLDEQGRLRQHVNIFIGNQLIRDREHLSDEISSDDDVYIMQALSGG